MSETGTFERYAALYDGFYRDRGYEEEVDAVVALLEEQPELPKTVLDLGCGTGGHLEIFARRGYRATGVERSAAMLECAKRRLGDEPVRLVHADARYVRLDQRFGAVASLFHVLSYQERDEDVIALMRTAAVHALGPVVIDFWYGPGVLGQGLECREARSEDSDRRVTRRASPTHHAEKRLVDVRYDFSILLGSGEERRFSETHRMRYFFDDEIARFASAAGLERVELRTWHGSAPPSDRDFAVCLVAKTR